MQSLQKKLNLKLNDEERFFLQKLVEERTVSSSRIRRAEILRDIDSEAPGRNATQIATLHQVSGVTVLRIYAQYRQYGLRTAVLCSRHPQTVILKNSERALLHNILNDPNSLQRHIKIAKILFQAEQDGADADVTLIAHSVSVTQSMVLRTLRSYCKLGLDATLGQPSFHFQLAREDRDTLNEMLKQEMKYWKRHRILMLLYADQAGPWASIMNISETTDFKYALIRKVCETYMQSGLDAALRWTNRKRSKSQRAFPVQLNDGERKQLQRLLKKGNCTKQAKQRALILLNADENISNKSNKEIATICDVNKMTVVTTCKRFAKMGLKCISSNQHYPYPATKRKKYESVEPIVLTADERIVLEKIVTESSGAKSRLKRAKILLLIDQTGEKKLFQHVAENVDVTQMTVYRTYKNYLSGGVHQAIDHKPVKSPIQTPLLNTDQETRLVKMFQSRPPKNYEKWTLRILAEQAVAKKIVPTISYETVRKVLKNHLGAQAPRIGKRK